MPSDRATLGFSRLSGPLSPFFSSHRPYLFCLAFAAAITSFSLVSHTFLPAFHINPPPRYFIFPYISTNPSPYLTSEHH